MKKQNDGFKLRLAMAIISLVFALISIGTAVFIMFRGSENETLGMIKKIFILIGSVYGVFTVLQFISAFVGRKSKGANVLSIILGIPYLPIYFLGLIGIVGGAQGIKALKHANESSLPEATEEIASTDGTSTQSSNMGGGAHTSLDDYAIDYENKPLVSSILDRENCENLLLNNERGETYEFKQLYVLPEGDKLYLLAETIGLSADEGGGMLVFLVDYDNDLVHIVNDDEIYNRVYNAYERAANGIEEHNIKRSEFKLDLYDASIDEKTWKQFKKTASQEELATIAIGAKYRICHSRILNIVYVVGIILSILLFWPTGGYSLIGYPVFAFLATKSIRYEDTYSQSYRKLDKEYKAFVDNYFNSNVGLTVLDCIIKIGILYITLPYQAILLMIGMFAPNFVISKNGILVSIPKGYDVGALGAIGAYYSSFNFLDEIEANSRKYTGTVTVDGHDISVHSSDDITYYDDNGHSYKKSGDKLIQQ